MILIYGLCSLIIGIVCGIFTGLTPGVHVNVVASLMVAFYASASLSNNLSLPISIFIVAVSITHAFFDYLPTLFLGVPGDEVYALLPGQRLIKEGRGGEALRLSIEGSWRGLILALIVATFCALLTLININLLVQAEAVLKPVLFWVLLSISLVLIFTEKNRLWAAILFLFSGLFGIVILGTPLVPGGSSAAFNVLFPALSGLFGVSGLLLALGEKTAKLPPQKEDIALNISEAQINQATLLGTASGMAVGLLPGLGSANAATLTLLLTGDRENKDNSRLYIVTTSAIQAADSVFGIAALYFIEKSRSGASVAIGSIIGEITVGQMLVILLTMGITGFLSRNLLLKSWKVFVSLINYLNYQALTLAVIVFIVTLVMLTTGFWGLAVLVGGTFLGLLPPLVKVRRTQLMGLFLVPVIMFFSGIQDSIVSFLRLEAQLSPSVTIQPIQLLGNLGICFTIAILFYSISLIKK